MASLLGYRRAASVDWWENVEHEGLQTGSKVWQGPDAALMSDDVVTYGGDIHWTHASATKRQILHTQAADARTIQSMVPLNGPFTGNSSTYGPDLGRRYIYQANPGLSKGVIDGGALVPGKGWTENMTKGTLAEGAYVFNDTGASPDQLCINWIPLGQWDDGTVYMNSIAHQKHTPIFRCVMDSERKKGNLAVEQAFSFIYVNWLLRRCDMKNRYFRQFMENGIFKFRDRIDADLIRDLRDPAKKDEDIVVQRALIAQLGMNCCGVNSDPVEQPIDGNVVGADVVRICNVLRGKRRLYNYWRYSQNCQVTGSYLFLLGQMVKFGNVVRPQWLPYTTPAGQPSRFPPRYHCAQRIGVVKHSNINGTVANHGHDDFKLEENTELAKIVTACQWDGDMDSDPSHFNPLQAAQLGNATDASGSVDRMSDRDQQIFYRQRVSQLGDLQIWVDVHHNEHAPTWERCLAAAHVAPLGGVPVVLAHPANPNASSNGDASTGRRRK
jgi:hypothetical protein